MPRPPPQHMVTRPCSAVDALLLVVEGLGEQVWSPVPPEVVAQGDGPAVGVDRGRSALGSCCQRGRPRPNASLISVTAIGRTWRGPCGPGGAGGADRPGEQARHRVGPTRGRCRPSKHGASGLERSRPSPGPWAGRRRRPSGICRGGRRRCGAALGPDDRVRRPATTVLSRPRRRGLLVRVVFSLRRSRSRRWVDPVGLPSLVEVRGLDRHDLALEAALGPDAGAPGPGRTACRRRRGRPGRCPTSGR